MKLQSKLRLIYLSEFFIFFHLFGGVLIPFFMMWGGLSLTEVMFLQAFFSLFIVLFEIPTGSLADVIGRKKTVYLGLAVIFLTVIWYGTSHGFWSFVLAEMGFAFSYALFSGAKEALMYDTLIDHHQEQQSKQVFSQFKISHLLGLMVSAPIGSYIGQAYGFQWPMILMTIPIALSFISLLFVPEPRTKHEHSPENLPGVARDTAALDPGTHSWIEQMRRGWKTFKSHPYLITMTFDMVTIWSLAFMIIWFYQVVLTDLGVSEASFGWFVTFSLLVQVIILKLYPLLEKLFGSKKSVITFSGLMPALGFLAIGLYPSVATVIVSLLLCSGFGLTRRTLYLSYVNKHIASHQRATVNSFVNLWIHASAFIIRPLSGIVADINMMIVFIGLAMACILVTLFSRVQEEMLVD